MIDDKRTTEENAGLDNAMALAAEIGVSESMDKAANVREIGVNRKATLHRRDKNRMASKARKAQRKPKKNRRKK